MGSGSVLLTLHFRASNDSAKIVHDTTPLERRDLSEKCKKIVKSDGDMFSKFMPTIQPRRNADFQICRIADFLIGRRHAASR
jgi:hypothetical protein